ncbi:hypothetical protein HK105_200124 [Polyrhizophydium stewartii]|uniref:Uncharacterized protein n=1 Tax=Polyrhizophydium stewartii TaxID=2732419 RepID=A0ABR4NKK9_9FUNG
MLASMTADERSIFAILQQEQDCAIQSLLLDLLKKRMAPAPTIDSAHTVVLLDLLQGVALIHYGSKLRSGDKTTLAMLLTFLASKESSVVVAALEALESILVDSSASTRAFEQVGGLALVCQILKQRRSPETVLHKCIELLCVYLQPEDENPDARLAEPAEKAEEALGRKQHSVEQLLGRSFVQRLMGATA